MKFQNVNMTRYWMSHSEIFDSFQQTERQDYSLMLWIVNVTQRFWGNLLRFLFQIFYI